MSDGAAAPERRFLFEIRGVLSVRAEDGDAAREAVEEWMVGVRRGESVALPERAGITYLRIYPEDDEPPTPPRQS